MDDYTVSRLAKIAGVSVRTLHHYDEIDLLKPSLRTATGYRLYGEKDLLRLQQILFFKELDFSLSEIAAVLDDPEFDQVEALRDHRRLLEQRALRLDRLLGTIDKTIQRLTEVDMKVTEEELYEGFSQEQIERYEREVREKYDPEMVRESNRRARNMSKARWQALKQEGDEVTRGLAGLLGCAADDPQVQALIARHHATIEQFYPVTAEIYRGLAQLYVENPEFTAFYDQYRPGLVHFMQMSMIYYADHSLE